MKSVMCVSYLEDNFCMSMVIISVVCSAMPVVSSECNSMLMLVFPWPPDATKR